MLITPRVDKWSQAYQQEVEKFVNRKAIRFMGKYKENFPFQTITLGENWMHMAAVTYNEAIPIDNLLDKIIYTSTRSKRITDNLASLEKISLEKMLDYINFCKPDSFAVIPLTDSRDEEVKKLGSLEVEKDDFYRINYNNRIITVIPEIKANSFTKNKGVYVFINYGNVSTKIH